MQGKPATPVLSPHIVRASDFDVHQFHGDGAINRAIYPDTVGSRRIFLGLAEFGPGTAPHIFHRHDEEIVGPPGAQRRLTYAPDFEEFYFVIEGEGEMQWIDDAGVRLVSPLRMGDAVYFPPGVAAHRVFNTGTGAMRVLYGGSPPARIELIG